MRKVIEWASAAVGAVLSFFSGLPPVISVLLAVMTLDYITGVICGIMGKSEKTETGYLSSSVAFSGLVKKMLIIFVVLLAPLLREASVLLLLRPCGGLLLPRLCACRF